MRKLLRKRPTIGVLAGWQVYTGTIHSFLDYVFRGIQAAAHNNDLNLMIGCGLSSTAYPGLFNTALPFYQPDVEFIPVGPWNTDGLIIAAPVFNQTSLVYFQGLIDSGFPIVFAGDRQSAPAVKVDNESGIHQAIDHLVAHGHARIAFLSGHTHLASDSSARYNAYCSGLTMHGLHYDPDLVASGQHTPGASYQAMMEIIRRNKPFSAVIASNDESAVGAMDALRDAGLSVPQDVAVIGFDDRLEARAQIPLLTTVHHPMFELGYQSAELLYHIIEGSAPLDSLISIPTHLIIRESCGCLPGTGMNRTEPEQALQPMPDFSYDLNPPIQAPFDPSGTVRVNTNAPAKIAMAAPVKRNDNVSATVAVRRMAEAVYKESQRLSRLEVEYLCYRLLDAFILSLTEGNANTFRQAMQQILEHVARIGDDLYAWQAGISVLQEVAPGLLNALPYILPQEQIDNMLHQARIAISEISRGQYSRQLVHQSEIANQIGQMTSRFFTAKNEEEVYTFFSQHLPGLGINAAVVALYEAGDARSASETTLENSIGQPLPFFTVTDPEVIWSHLKMPPPQHPGQERFATCQFPPPGLFPEEHTFHLAVLPLNGPEGMLGYAAFASDELEPLGSIVTQLVAAIRGVRLYQEAVAARMMAEESRQMAEEACQMAEEANQLKSRFLSMVSHELRTPLNLIYGLSNMILEQSRQVNDQECIVNRKDLERIDISAHHLESLVRDVLDLARSDLGQLKLNCEPLDVREVLQAVSVIGDHLARDKDLLWRTEIPERLPTISGDRTRLRQVVLNLVNNAAKFTERGSVTLSAEAADGHVTISVSDTGLGIPLDEQCLIFDEFRQSRRTTARGFGGLGLGLAICKRLVEMHHGKIGIYSSGEEGSGSTFYIQLPTIEDKPTVEQVPDSSENSAERVLLLVKNTTSGESLYRHLTQQGFHVQVHTLDDSTNWMDWLQPNPPDKIILDLGLTSKRGWDILKSLKENPTSRDIPVLFYALENDQSAGALLDLNFQVKPLSSTELAKELFTRGLVYKHTIPNTGQSLLVVDDDPGILELHSRILATLAGSYRILQARNGREALEIIQNEHPALVLLDLIMPEMDGFTVLERMQADESTRNIPVVVLTSQVLTEEDMARLNTGVANVLSKGMYNFQETLEHISAALTRKRKPGTDTQRLVLKAMVYIHSHYKDPISRSEIAAYVGVSERHLARCFQQEMGLSPIIYLNRFRVNMARSLLLNGKLSITDVAMEVGFSTGGYFTRVFHSEMGMSPREYQNSIG